MDKNPKVSFPLPRPNPTIEYPNKVIYTKVIDTEKVKQILKNKYVPPR